LFVSKVVGFFVCRKDLINHLSFGGNKMKSERKIERSIDSLQRIYAVIIALSFSEALRRTFLDQNQSFSDNMWLSYLPELVTFLMTAVPFIHGMNRHLDEIACTVQERKKRWLFFILLLDFAIFLAQSCLFFLLAVTVKEKIFFFQLWMVVLAVDLVWLLLTTFSSKLNEWWWAVDNTLTIALSCFVIYFLHLRLGVDQDTTLWILMTIAIVRTICDYTLARKFYFPEESICD